MMSEQLSNTNVNTTERAVSGLLGAALLPIGLRRRGLLGALLAAAGAYLVYRGASGRCSIYRRLGTGSTEEFSDKGVTVRRSVTVDLTPTETYMNLRRFESLPVVMEHLESVSKREDGSYLWRLREGGMTFDCITRLTEDRPGECFSWEALEGSDIRCDGQVRLLSAGGQRGTEILIDITVKAPGGRATALLGPLVRRMASHQLDREVDRVKQTLDSEDADGSRERRVREQTIDLGGPV